MKVSMKWLDKYVSVSDVAPAKLAELLTLAGLEVESIESPAQGTNLTVGHVLSCIDHPQSDHLHLTQVDIGSEVLQIVCGAPNIAADQKVIVAKCGAVLPQITIQKTIVRGEESNGMICSLLELGVESKYLSEEQKNGIEVLPAETPIGADPLEILHLDDTILDVKQTPNRSDFNAMWSIAMEVGALLDRPVTLPLHSGVSLIGKPTDLKISSETDACPVFLGKIIGRLTVKESPLWLKEALMACGIKSINNVVDISNYVMVETGQPLHFYDLAKIPNHEITVKDNLNCEMKTLDEGSIRLDPSDIVITSGNVPIGLAGIMGGDDSKIDELTSGIIIEAAVFSPVRIRNTARRVNLQTEASLRFQKGLEPLASIKAMDRAVQLLIDYADAESLEATVQHGTYKTDLATAGVTHAHIESLLGTKIELTKVIDLLSRLNLSPVMKGEEIICTIPSYRLDLSIAEDLIEEVGRMSGYESLQGKLPVMETVSGLLNERQCARRRIKTLCTGWGLNEVISYTLVSKAKVDQAILPVAEPYELLSPISDERRYVRNSLLPSLLEVAVYNNSHKVKDYQLFEIGNAVGKKDSQERFSFVLSGNRTTSQWQKHVIPVDYYTGKGIIETIANELGFDSKRLYFKELKNAIDRFHPFRSAEVYLGRELFGIVGEIHPNYAHQLGLGNVVIGEFNLEILLNNKAGKIKFTPIVKYPTVVRDIALVVKTEVSAAAIEEVLTKAGKPYVQSVKFFDVYTGSHVEEGFKSIALTIYYQSAEATMTDEEINRIHNKLISQLETQLHARLRG